MIKVHAESRFSLDASTLSKLLNEGQYNQLQELLDRNAAVYALFITDCTSASQDCPSQKILFMTNPRLVRPAVIKKLDLKKEGYFLLRQPAPINPAVKKSSETTERRIIGRVYSVSTIPTFSEDYRSWMFDPFADNDLWRRY